MNATWVLLAIILIAAVVIGELAKKQVSGSAERPKRRWPLTKNEAAMYHRLVQALPGKVIFAQVSFGALLTARSRAARNRFDRKVADFVVCDKALQVLAVIELDDSSHKGREFKDAARDKLLLEAGYRVIRYPRIPNVEKLRSDFGEQPTITVVTDEPEVLPATPEQGLRPIEPQIWKK